MAYGVIMLYHLHMPSYILRTFTEYPFLCHIIQKKWLPHKRQPEIRNIEILYSAFSTNSVIPFDTRRLYH